MIGGHVKFRLYAAVGLAVVSFGMVRPVPARAEESPYQWQSIPFAGGGFVDGFLYHPKQKDILYARTDVGGMYRYDFAAKRWVPLLDHLGYEDRDLMGVLSIAVDPSDPTKIYAACGLYTHQWARKGAVLRSRDQGMSWEKTEMPIRIGGNADGRGTGERLAVDPKNGNLIFYGSNLDGLWKSLDAGKTFAKAGSPAVSISLVAIDPGSGEVFLGSADDEGALLVSRDRGETFQNVAGTPRQVPQRIAFAPDGAVYATFAQGTTKQAVNPSFAERGGVWKRDTSGHWTDISPLRPDDKAKFGYSGVDVGPDGMLAVATLDRWWPGDEVFLSRDGGAHWLTLSDKSHHDLKTYPWLSDLFEGRERMGGWISDLKINPFDHDEMIYVGPWASRNLSQAGSGRSVEFEFRSADLEEAATMQLVSPVQGPRVMAAFGDIAGAAWFDITKPPESGLFHPANETNRSIDYAGLQPQIMARTVDRSGTHGYYSEDGGKRWTLFPASPYQAAREGQEWRSPGVLAVSARGSSFVWAPEKDSAFYSTDKGKTWRPSSGWPSSRDQQLVVVSDKAIDGVYYVFDRLGSVYISVDAGASFKPAVNGLPKVEPWEKAQLAVVPGRIRDLWLAAPYGLVHSPDPNTPATNMKDVSAAWAVGFGAPSAKAGYPAVYLWGRVKKQEGIWRSDDEGHSWVRINDNAHQFGAIDAIAGDMREYGTVYIAPGGRGLMVGHPERTITSAH